MSRFIFTNSLVLLSLLLTIACSNPKQMPKTDKQVKNSLPVEMVNSYEGIKSDYFELDQLHLDNNRLEVVLTYGGGCGDVNYEVFYNDVVLQSYPPQVFLKLKFTDNDPCRAIIKDTISIDLSYFEAMARGGGLQIGLSGFNQQATYALPLK